jgi:hypothetical protein
MEPSLAFLAAIIVLATALSLRRVWSPRYSLATVSVRTAFPGESTDAIVSTGVLSGGDTLSVLPGVYVYVGGFYGGPRLIGEFSEDVGFSGTPIYRAVTTRLTAGQIDRTLRLLRNEGPGQVTWGDRPRVKFRILDDGSRVEFEFVQLLTNLRMQVEFGGRQRESLKRAFERLQTGVLLR